MACPNCDSNAVPRVVGRSEVGIWNPSLATSLRCPACYGEWTEESPLGPSVFRLRSDAGHWQAAVRPGRQSAVTVFQPPPDRRRSLSVWRSVL